MWDLKMYYDAIQDEHLKICWGLAEKPRLRTAAIICMLYELKQTDTLFI